MAFKLTAGDVNFLAELGKRAQHAMALFDMREQLAANDYVDDERIEITFDDDYDLETARMRSSEIDLLLEAATIASALGEQARSSSYAAQARSLIENLDDQ